MNRFLSLLVLLLHLAAASAVSAAPRATFWERWAGSDESSSLTVDHTLWKQFLAIYVVAGDDGINRVRYGKVSKPDREALERYLGMLSETPVSRLRRPEQLAFWINLYNAVTVQMILANYPVDSIRAIRSGLFSPGPWGRKLIAVEAVEITLDDVEHRILRPIWRDPQIHYALNCASLGCPNLQRNAFTAVNADTLLTKAAREFVNHPAALRLMAKPPLFPASTTGSPLTSAAAWKKLSRIWRNMPKRILPQPCNGLRHCVTGMTGT